MNQHKLIFSRYQPSKFRMNTLIQLFLYLLIMQIVSCFTNPKLLTNSGIKHSTPINCIKMTSDYRYVYTAGDDGKIIIWKFHISNFTLSYLQDINVGGTIYWDMVDALYVWNNGAQLFAGSSNAMVKVYLFNNSTGTYMTDGMTPGLGDYIYSVWVNPAGNYMIVSTRSGCKGLNYVSNNWVLNTPPYLTNLGALHYIYAMPINNGQKIIVQDWANSLLRVLKYNGTDYQLHQTITLNGFNVVNGVKNCHVSSNQNFITCFGQSASGGASQYNCYKLNTGTDVYQDVSLLNTLASNVETSFSYMNPNMIYTILQKNTKTLYKYQLMYTIIMIPPLFTTTTFVASYSLLSSFTFYGQIPHRMQYQRAFSDFQLIATQQGNVYILFGKCRNTSISNCQVCYPNLSICSLCTQGFDLQFDRCDNCLPGYYINGTICSSCGINCYNCSSLTTCAVCMPGWVLNSSVCNACVVTYYNNGSDCISCISNCKICSNSTDCIECLDGYTYYGIACCTHGTLVCNSNGSSSTCIMGFYLVNFTCQCRDINYMYNYDNQSCYCPLPYRQAGGVCGNMTNRGLVNCLNAQRLSDGTIVCRFCSSYIHQSLFNNQCYCRDGFHDPNNTGLCIEKCGDGLVFLAQCDDYNTISGDGCSSNCIIQPGYACSVNNSLTTCKSQTVLRYSIGSIIKDYIESKATIILNIQNLKHLLSFPVMDYNFSPQSQYISLFVIINQNPYTEHKIQNLYVSKLDSDYNLHIEFQFNFTIEQLNARLQLNYQNTRYMNSTQTLSFQMKGANMRLQYSQKVATYKTLSILNLVIVILSILILLFGLFTPKFIGLQMILTMQLIFFSQILIQNPTKWPIGFLYLKYLKFSTGYNNFIGFSQILPKENYSIKFVNLNMKKYVIQNINVTFILVFIASAVALIFLIKRFLIQAIINALKQKYKGEANLKAKQQIQSEIRQINYKTQLVYLLNQKSYQTASQLTFWSILPLLSSLTALLMVDKQNVVSAQFFINEYVTIKTGSFIVLFVTSFIFLICLNNFTNFWLSYRAFLETQKKRQQTVYKRFLFLYILTIGYMILFLNEMKVPVISLSVIVLLVELASILLLVQINPYRQSLRIHTIALVINHFVYSVFLAVIVMINYIQDLDQIIILLLGYLITVSCFTLVILSIVRLYYEYRYGEELEIRIMKQREEKEILEKKKEKQRLQRKRRQLQRQASKNLDESDKMRFRNKYLVQNQELEQKQIQLLNWLQTRKWPEDKKEQYYYKKFHQKPLNWLKFHNQEQYQKKISQLNQRKMNQLDKRIKKQEQKQKSSDYNNLVSIIESSHIKKMKKLQTKVKDHIYSMQHDPSYTMNVMQKGMQKHIVQDYQLKY